MPQAVLPANLEIVKVGEVFRDLEVVLYLVPVVQSVADHGSAAIINL